MEPCFNPALEAQAIGRVHRLGQKRRVEIVRLIMQDSVETRLRKMLEKKFGAETPTKDGKLAIVGNIKSDKTDELMEEFDLLFGVESPAVPLKTETVTSALV